MRALRVGKLIDGTGAAPLDDAVLLIDDGRIAAVGRSGDIAIPDGVETIDATEHTLMPGMVDVHVHLAYSGIPDKRAFRAEGVDSSYPLMALRAAAHAHATLRAGFTAVRDLNAPGGVIIDLRKAVEAGYVPGPHIRACGLGLSPTGGHMDQPGFGDHVRLEGMNAVCDGPESFRRGVREQVKRGADLIKLNICVSSVADPERPYRQEMTDEEIAAACDEAHRLERSVAAHTSGGPAITTAVRLGLDTVEHGHWLDQETADLMAERGAFYVPTLLVNERNFEFGKDEMGATDASWRWLELSREAKWISLDTARRAGVKIAVGTDAGFMLPHGEMNAREIALLVDGGLTPLEAITAATRTGAELLGIDDAGTLQPGQRADLLLVDGDPSTDITTLQDLSRLRVFKGGEAIV
jgi:imidazolonepropionase-like amidohydrolase